MFNKWPSNGLQSPPPRWPLSAKESEGPGGALAEGVNCRGCRRGRDLFVCGLGVCVCGGEV